MCLSHVNCSNAIATIVEFRTFNGEELSGWQGSGAPKRNRMHFSVRIDGPMCNISRGLPKIHLVRHQSRSISQRQTNSSTCVPPYFLPHILKFKSATKNRTAGILQPIHQKLHIFATANLAIIAHCYMSSSM